MLLHRRTFLEFSAASTLSLCLPLSWTRVALARDEVLRWNGLDPSSGLWIVIRPESAPSRAFSGVFRSPQLGKLVLAQEGAEVLGRFHYQRGTARVAGVLEGRARGNALRFAWRELHKTGAEELSVGGRGFLLFDPPGGDQTRVRLFGRRDYRVLAPTVRHGVYEFATRSGGPLSATRLAEGGA